MELSPLSYLRTTVDGSDGLMKGHRIMKTAGATQHAARMRRVPVWALDDAKIRELIRYRFPKMKTDPEQRRQAGRMARLIYLYYRVGVTAPTVAEELKMTVNAVKCVVRRISKAMLMPLRPLGRSKKGDPIGGTHEESGLGHNTL